MDELHIDGFEVDMEDYENDPDYRKYVDSVRERQHTDEITGLLSMLHGDAWYVIPRLAFDKCRVYASMKDSYLEKEEMLSINFFDRLIVEDEDGYLSEIYNNVNTGSDYYLICDDEVVGEGYRNIRVFDAKFELKTHFKGTSSDGTKHYVYNFITHDTYNFIITKRRMFNDSKLISYYNVLGKKLYSGKNTQLIRTRDYIYIYDGKIELANDLGIADPKLSKTKVIKFTDNCLGIEAESSDNWFIAFVDYSRDIEQDNVRNYIENNPNADLGIRNREDLLIFNKENGNYYKVNTEDYTLYSINNFSNKKDYVIYTYLFSTAEPVHVNWLDLIRKI